MGSVLVILLCGICHDSTGEFCLKMMPVYHPHPAPASSVMRDIIWRVLALPRVQFRCGHKRLESTFSLRLHGWRSAPSR